MIRISRREIAGVVVLSVIGFGTLAFFNHEESAISRKMGDRYTGHDADTDWKTLKWADPKLPASRPSKQH